MSYLVNLPDLSYVNLANNDIQSIDSLLGQTVINNFGTGYAETGQNWTGSSNSGAFAGDYRILPSPDKSSKTIYTFSGLAAGKYEVYATWPSDPTLTYNATYTIGSATTAVDQQLPPVGPTFGGRPWQDLGGVAVPANGSGTVQVQLSNTGSGNLAADAVRLVQNVLPNLQYVDLRGNHLNNAAYGYVLPGLATLRPGGYSQTGTITVSGGLATVSGLDISLLTVGQVVTGPSIPAGTVITGNDPQHCKSRGFLHNARGARGGNEHDPRRQRDFAVRLSGGCR